MWQPQFPEHSQMWSFMRFIESKSNQVFNDYHELYRWSITRPAEFWQGLCDFFVIKFDTSAYEIVNVYTHPLTARWFSGASFNFAQKLLSRNDSHPALISINEERVKEILTYADLNRLVANCAQGLRKAGIEINDRVVGVMPNISSTIIAMLATTSIGAVWASCSPDFGAEAIIDRLGQLEPKILFISDGHIYLGKQHIAREKILSLQQAIPTLLQIVVIPVVQTVFDYTLYPKMISWDEFLQPIDQHYFTIVPFRHPVYIMFSSGTTGKPKCIIHSAGGTLLQHIKELGLHCDINQNDNLCFYTTCGWMMWNWMVSALALGSTLTLYEGAPNYPDVYQLFSLLDTEKVSIFGTSPRFLANVAQASARPNQYYSLYNLKTILTTGAPLLPQQYDFVYQHIKSDVQLSSISGGTDIISCFALGNPLLPVYRNEIQCIGLGMAVQVFDQFGQSVIAERGELVCTAAFPSMPIGFWNDPDNSRYYAAYFARFPGVWMHGDFAVITNNQGLIIYGRSDTVLNPGGVRIGTAEIYRQIEPISQILESAVIGQEWANDIRIVLFVKLIPGLILDDQLQKHIRDLIRHNASPRHVPAVILQVTDIPRTINGKIIELAIQQIVHGRKITNLGSIANPEALICFKNRPELDAFN